MTHQPPHADESADALHPPVEQLADLAEDLLPADRAGELSAHLADCPECADTMAALEELSALLAADRVEPMPAEVARRIDAALAEAQQPAEQPSAPTVPGTPPLPNSTPGPTRPPARSDRSTRPGTRRRRRLLLAAAACLAALGLGTGGVLLSQPSSSPSAVGASAPGQPGGSSSPGAQLPAERPAQAAGPEFTAAGLPDQIHRLLPPTAAVQPHTTTEQGSGALGGGGLPQCVRQAVAGHQGEQPVLTAHGSYQGAPVDAYVFRDDADPARLDVFLLTPGCTTTPAAVQLQQEVPAG
ncbi:anti-sigma factor family protein [Kitasatospora sp. NPDC006697]|uniref:anti-sigma factor family protein n=1 Tax=Kitasatospora sp. NPDC006697 TaxID=3364020 RepID=UPI00369963BB